MSARFSDDAVSKATGRDWASWFEFLTAADGASLSHKEIVALLKRDGGVTSGWWRQNVTNEFEKQLGRREVGSTVDAGFQIGVQKTLPVDVPTAWKLLTSAEGAREWIGTDAGPPTEPGEIVTTAEGHQFELRTIERGERMRLKRTDGETGAETIVQVTLAPAKTGTAVRFHHERLTSGEHRDEMREHWRKVAGRILSIV